MTLRKTKYKGAEEESAMKTVYLEALNDNQRDYLNALNTCQQTVVCGCSGTGKTYMAATFAANLYARKQIDKIVLTRPNIPVGKDPGALPGNINEKFAPWAAPVMDVLTKQLGSGVVETAIKNNNIEMAPLTYMRGRSFNNAFIILDEAQNTSIAEMKMFLTRIGENCRVVINGDIRQSDIKDQSGLAKIIHLIKVNSMPIPIIEFTVDDIVRSDICKQWIIAFQDAGI